VDRIASSGYVQNYEGRKERGRERNGDSLTGEGRRRGESLKGRG